MKKNLIILSIISSLFICNELKSQNLIALNSNGTSTFHYSLADAVTNSVHGDTIYIPGGTFTIGDQHINKRLTIIGAGHNPDSTLATNFSYLYGSLRLLTGADSGSVTGIYLTGNMVFGSNTSNQTVLYYNINRCNISTLNLSFDGGSATNSKFITISENIIRNTLNGGNAVNVLVEKNVITPNLQYFNGQCSFNNNIFIHAGYYSSLINYINNCAFLNNIFVVTGSGATAIGSANSNSFTRNIFIHNQTFPAGSNIGDSNLVSQPVYSIFDTLYSTSVFSYQSKYNLKTTCPGKNFGTDGKDLGVYGTGTPFKEGSVPYNPHIQEKMISPTTDPNGMLNIKLKVNAQER